jgi:PAS domain S-box-containing protein
MREGLAASGAALAALVILYLKHWWPFLFSMHWWPLLCVAGALVVLSFRIFPLLKKEETVSIIFASFFLVLICSLAVYAISNERYTGLRKNYVQEKITEFSKPEENWLQFYVPNICMDISYDQSVASRLLSKKESTAFELWAESSLSRSGYSCMFGMYDAAGALLSRFAVGMPFDLPRRRPDYALLSRGPFVESLRAETRGGAVFYYSGYAPIFRMRGELLGWVEITIPYFFENPELLARTGRMAPEILQNIERGTTVRRSDEPEKQLVARISGNRVKNASDPALRAGSVLPAHEGEWLLLSAGHGTYNCGMKLDENGEGYLVGYRVASVSENLLQWATVVSLEVILALVSFLVLFVLNRLPVFKGVVPDVSPARGLGFRQKVLFSFLLVSMLPVMILGIFSSQVIAQRFRAEEENKALSGAHAAGSLIDHSIRTEAASLAGGQYIGELLASEGKGDVSDDAGIDKRRFTLIGSDGEELYGSAVAGLTKEQRSELLANVNVDRVTVSYEAPILYAGVVVPIMAHGSRGGYLYYRRALDDDFVKSVAVALGLGTEINIYYDALMRASSERELFVGGFLDPICAPSVFVDIALQENSATVLRETLGDYSYYVASVPLQSLGGAASGVLSVPMLYQPTLMQEEVHKTPMLILGLLALLFVATVTLGVFLAGKIFNPIAALQGGTRKIIEGELEFKLEAGAPDEIGELVESFNTMTAALREARRGLLERQRYLSAVLDNIATGVMATGSDGTIITLNPAGERILRLSAADVIGRKPNEVFGEGRTPLLDLFPGAGEDVREVEITLFSGETARTVKAVVASLVGGGERLGTLVVFDDLTELIRSKKLAAWVEMARQIAHEVKNPLTPIKLSAQLMKKAFESGSDDFDGIFKSGVDTVIQQTEILRRIASEFSNFGKAMRLSPETVPLAAFLGEVVSYYTGAEDVRMSLSCEDGIAVRADREALRKILVNLLENAIEASSDGGAISVAGRRDGANAIMSVVDSGKGLSPEMEGRLFEPYFSTKTNGIGLGLAISQGLARAMDGEIRLRNREGTRGVEAAVILPLAKGE